MNKLVAQKDDLEFAIYDNLFNDEAADTTGASCDSYNGHDESEWLGWLAKDA